MTSNFGKWCGCFASILINGIYTEKQKSSKSSLSLVLAQILSSASFTYGASDFTVLQDGLRITYFWIKEQIEKEKVQGIDLSIYGSSKVVGTQAPVQLGSLRAADGKE